jgi:hypothetical protein
MALAGALAVAGCGKPQAESQAAPSEPEAPAATLDVEPPTAPAEASPARATNEILSRVAEVARKPLASRSAQANRALEESYDRALIACQAGDYAAAVSELRMLARTPGLTREQDRAVQDLLAQTLRAATEPVPATGTNQTRPGGAEFTRKSLASPFAQARQALKESYDSVLVAVQIGDYDRAVAELKVLAQNPDLTPEQKQAVQELMAQTSQTPP